MEKASPPDIPVLDYEPIEPGKKRGSGKRSGLYGCFIVLLVVCALVGGCAYYVYNSVLDTILENAPSTWPQLDLAASEIEAAGKKLEQIITISTNNDLPTSFSFNDRELNALVARFDRFKDRAFFTLAEDELRVAFSVPYRKRFINGHLQGIIGAEQGAVSISLDSARVGSYVFSGEILQQTAAFLEEECNKSPEVKEVLKAIHAVEIKGGLILIELKPETGEA
jgi:hypothetical protein